MTHENIVHSEVSGIHVCAVKCISWSAIIVGALVAIGLEFLVNLFGLAIGLGAYSKTGGSTTLVMGGLVGSVIGVMIPLFIAGWVSGFIGRLSCPNKCLGIIYGFTTWCLALIVSVLLISGISEFIAAEYTAFTNPHSIIAELTNNMAHYPAEMSKASHGSATTALQNMSMSETEANAVAKSLLLFFILFLVGAIAAAYGGYVGMKSRNNRE